MLKLFSCRRIISYFVNFSVVCLVSLLHGGMPILIYSSLLIVTPALMVAILLIFSLLYLTLKVNQDIGVLQ